MPNVDFGTHKSGLVVGLVGSAAVHAAFAAALNWAVPEPSAEADDALSWIEVEVPPEPEAPPPIRVIAPPPPPVQAAVDPEPVAVSEPEPEPEPEPTPEPAAQEPTEVDEPDPAHPELAAQPDGTDADQAPDPQPDPAGDPVENRGDETSNPLANAAVQPPAANAVSTATPAVAPERARQTLADLVEARGEPGAGAHRQPRNPPDNTAARQALGFGLAALTSVPDTTDAFIGEPPPGVAADLNAPLPGEPVVSVLLRLDRVRNSIWADRIEAILAPLPDYRTIAAHRTGSFIDYFDAIVMSSPRPNDVTATLVAALPGGASNLGGDFLGTEEITWENGPRGAIGTRARASLPHPGDRRVFLRQPGVPATETDPAVPGWTLLTPPEYLTTDPAGPAGAADWLTSLPALLAESGAEAGPFAIVSLRSLPPAIRIPMLGRLIAPERLTATMTHVGRGFYLRGTALFADEREAAATAQKLTGARDQLLDNPLIKVMLTNLGLLNAARGLRLRQVGNAIAFTTSMSIMDARGVLDNGATWTRRFYEAKERARERAGRPPGWR